MKDEVNIKEIVFCTTIVIIIFIIVDIFVVPQINFRLGFVTKTLHKITSSQTIAPNRLYINAWRSAKNLYVDKTMNNQNWTRWRNRYLKEIKTKEDAEIAINTMLSSLNDPYTKFLRSDLFAKQKIILDSKITGVGVMFNKSGDDVVVNHVLENSPAQKANIKPGDTIISINGELTDNADIENLINNIEDEKQDTVELILKRDGNIITKKLKKTEIPIKTMMYRITNDNIGIITIANIMGKQAIDDFKDILFKSNETRGIIIDLRNNYGGIFINVANMIDFMIDKKEIVSVKSRKNNRYLHIYTEGNRIFKQKPIVILINHKTASAAEIFAGVLKIHANAVLLGENSFGKNSIQYIIPMQNASGLIITTEKYILPDGSDIAGIGLIPDKYVEQYSLNNDNQKTVAVELINSTIKKASFIKSR